MSKEHEKMVVQILQNNVDFIEQSGGDMNSTSVLNRIELTGNMAKQILGALKERDERITELELAVGLNQNFC